MTKAEEAILKAHLGGTYGGPSLSYEEGEWVLYRWADAPVSIDERYTSPTLKGLVAKIVGGES